MQSNNSQSALMDGSSAELAPQDKLVEGLSAEELRLVFRNHAAGVAVITADAGDGPVAMTATSVFSVSATPPLLVFSVSSLSSATPAILRAQSLVVHLLDVSDVGIARLCATSGADRFADTSMWSRLPTGEPYFVQPKIRVRGRVVNTYEAGTSHLVVVNATHSSAAPAETAHEPLMYHNRTWLALNREQPLI